MARKTFKHRSFKRSYREDYVRDLKVPGMMHHILYSFKLIFDSWKIFLPFLLIVVVMMIFLVGISNEYSKGQVTVFASLIFLMIWLVTIFVIRHKMAGNKITLSDALFNSMGPLFSTLVIWVAVAIEMIPIMLLIIATSAAVETRFLDMPFYALLFLVFAGLMLLLSFYFLSSTIIAMVAVTAPGMYPLEALKNSFELMAGRRIRFTLRIIALLLTLFVIWFFAMLPFICLREIPPTPFVTIYIMTLGCISAVYVSVYFYVYYRWMLDMDES